ncbi:MAG: polyphosphate kinase 2 [Gammaproteobacteria bacterium]|jgi:polyphosphate kinase|nr:polyphosphate kinase 2 [Gammaproteobacteria bacterium]MBT4491954.1 polyphosphate kinase 2 [Gammaproteobacteria bacterium]MBT7371464.1 polyphosphate kinase 2 [Gammaproteobacteria bacterium]
MANSSDAGRDNVGRVSKIQEVLDQIGKLDEESEDHREQAQTIVNHLKEKQRKAILKSALISHLEAEALKPYQAELIKMQAYLEANKRKAIILFDGRDASGKGGTIRRVTRYMNEKHYRSIALGKPSDVQRTELHMKRYIEHFPHAGEIALFDRSWYNRAMVEPVMGFCTKAQYRQFMNRVNDYEESFISDGTTLIKLYFSVSKKEQAKRFKRRRDDPLRKWKLSEVDIQAQELWDEFTRAKYQLLKKTHTKKNPWYIIRSDDKQLARIETIKLILTLVKYRGRSRALDFELNPDVVITGSRELQNMEKQLARKGAFKE